MPNMEKAPTHISRHWDGAEMAQAFANWVNGSSRGDFIDFAEKLCHAEHRTLQQQSHQVFKLCQDEWAKIADKGAGHYDLRNEQTVKECQQIRDLLQGGHMGDAWTHTALI